MPTKRTTTTTNKKVEEINPTEEVLVEEIPVEVEEDFNLEKKVTVRSIAEWTTGFQRIETNGDVTIPPNGTVRLSRGEIISQVQNGNLLFTGIDGQGSHATLYIEDKPTRIEADFETETSQQNVINKERIDDLFAIKYAIMGFIRKGNFNDYNKVRAVEDYTKLQV